MSSPRVVIPDSAPRHPAQARWIKEADPDQQVNITVLVRRPKAAAHLSEALLSGQYRPPNREAAESTSRADPADMANVRNFLEQSGFKILDENPAARSFHAHATAEQIDKAFGVKLGWYENSLGQRYLSYEGDILIPGSSSGIITAVLGLDQRPVARHDVPSGGTQ